MSDRSTARVTSGQRVSLNAVERAEAEQRDGATYWVYTHISQACNFLFDILFCGSLHAIRASGSRERPAIVMQMCRSHPA